MNFFASLFHTFLTALGGSASFNIGHVQIGITTVAGSPTLVLSLASTSQAATTPAPQPTTSTESPQG